MNEQPTTKNQQLQQQLRVSTGFFRKAADDIPTNAAPIGTYKVPSWDGATASTNTIFK